MQKAPEEEEKEEKQKENEEEEKEEAEILFVEGIITATHHN